MEHTESVQYALSNSHSGRWYTGDVPCPVCKRKESRAGKDNPCGDCKKLIREAVRMRERAQNIYEGSDLAEISLSPYNFTGGLHFPSELKKEDGREYPHIMHKTPYRGKREFPGSNSDQFGRKLVKLLSCLHVGTCDKKVVYRFVEMGSGRSDHYKIEKDTAVNLIELLDYVCKMMSDIQVEAEAKGKNFLFQQLQSDLLGEACK